MLWNDWTLAVSTSRRPPRARVGEDLPPFANFSASLDHQHGADLEERAPVRLHDRVAGRDQLLRLQLGVRHAEEEGVPVRPCPPRSLPGSTSLPVTVLKVRTCSFREWPGAGSEVPAAPDPVLSTEYTCPATFVFGNAAFTVLIASDVRLTPSGSLRFARVPMTGWVTAVLLRPLDGRAPDALAGQRVVEADVLPRPAHRLDGVVEEEDSLFLGTASRAVRTASAARRPPSR